MGKLQHSYTKLLVDEDGIPENNEYTLRDAVEYLRTHGKSGWEINQLEYPINPYDDGIADLYADVISGCVVWDYDESWNKS
jgi:hypothetical protein